MGPALSWPWLVACEYGDVTPVRSWSRRNTIDKSARWCPPQRNGHMTNFGWRSEAQTAKSGVNRNGETDDCRALRGRDDSRHRHRRCPDLQESLVGTTDGEHRNRFCVCSLLFAIPQAPMK